MPTKGKDGFYHSKVVPAKGVKPVYFRARTLREFNQRRQQIIEDYRTGRDRHDIAFVDLAQEWFDTVRAPNMRPSTLRSAKCSFKNHVLSVFPPQQLARAIRYKDLQHCLDLMAGHSYGAICAVAGYLKGACAYGVAEGVMDADYSAALRYPKCATPATRSALLDHQAASLRSAFLQDPRLVAVALLYYAGLRTGEALGLRWEDVDFSRQRIHIIQQLGRVTRQVDPTKTATSVRYVPMPDELQQILRPLRSLPHLYVCSNTSRPMSTDSFTYSWVRMLAALGMARLNETATKKMEKDPSFHPYYQLTYYDTDFTPHYLRHNYATALFRAHMDPAFAMRILGHKKYDTTLNLYTDIENMLENDLPLDDHLPVVLTKVAEKLQARRVAIEKSL